MRLFVSYIYRSTNSLTQKEWTENCTIIVDCFPTTFEEIKDLERRIKETFPDCGLGYEVRVTNFIKLTD